MNSQSFVTIFPEAMIILWAGLWLMRRAKIQPTRRQLAYVLVGAIILTGASMLVHENGFAGTNHITRFGWPHWFLSKTLPFEGNAGWSWKISWGPLGAYVLVNIIFHFSVLMAVIGVALNARRSLSAKPVS